MERRVVFLASLIVVDANRREDLAKGGQKDAGTFTFNEWTLRYYIAKGYVREDKERRILPLVVVIIYEFPKHIIADPTEVKVSHVAIFSSLLELDHRIRS